MCSLLLKIALDLTHYIVDSEYFLKLQLVLKVLLIFVHIDAEIEDKRLSVRLLHGLRNLSKKKEEYLLAKLLVANLSLFVIYYLILMAVSL